MQNLEKGQLKGRKSMKQKNNKYKESIRVLTEKINTLEENEIQNLEKITILKKNLDVVLDEVSERDKVITDIDKDYFKYKDLYETNEISKSKYISELKTQKNISKNQEIEIDKLVKDNENYYRKSLEYNKNLLILEERVINQQDELNYFSDINTENIENITKLKEENDEYKFDIEAYVTELDYQQKYIEELQDSHNKDIYSYKIKLDSNKNEKNKMNTYFNSTIEELQNKLLQFNENNEIKNQTIENLNMNLEDSDHEKIKLNKIIDTKNLQLEQLEISYKDDFVKQKSHLIRKHEKQIQDLTQFYSTKIKDMEKQNIIILDLLKNEKILLDKELQYKNTEIRNLESNMLVIKDKNKKINNNLIAYTNKFLDLKNINKFIEEDNKKIKSHNNIYIEEKTKIHKENIWLTTEIDNLFNKNEKFEKEIENLEKQLNISKYKIMDLINENNKYKEINKDKSAIIIQNSIRAYSKGKELNETVNEYEYVPSIDSPPDTDSWSWNIFNYK